MNKFIAKLCNWNKTMSYSYLDFQFNFIPCLDIRSIYLIPTVQLGIYDKSCELNIYFLFSNLYICCSLKNYKNES